MTDRVRLETERRDDAVVATLVGEIDAVNHLQVGESLLSAALDGGPVFVASLDAVSYIDSNGVRMLFSLAQELDRSRIQWAVALAPDAPLQRLFKVTAFDEVARILDSVDDALVALQASP